MGPVDQRLSISATWADAVFTSGLQCRRAGCGRGPAGRRRDHPSVRLLWLCQTGAAGVRRSLRNSGRPDALGTWHGPSGVSRVRRRPAGCGLRRDTGYRPERPASYCEEAR